MSSSFIFQRFLASCRSSLTAKVPSPHAGVVSQELVVLLQDLAEPGEVEILVVLRINTNK